MRSCWMVVWRMTPFMFSDPSTFWAGIGLARVWRVSAWFLEYSSFMMSPSALLSNSALALIFRPLSFPRNSTLMAMEGDLIFRMTSGGTGSELRVARVSYLFIRADLGESIVLTDSAAVERFKNPGGPISAWGCSRIHHAKYTG